MARTGPDNIGVLTTRINDPSDITILELVQSAFGLLVIHLRRTEASLAQIGIKLGLIARHSDACRRLMTIPSVGVVAATTLVSSVRDPADSKPRRRCAS